MHSRFSSEARAHIAKDEAVASLASTSALLAQSNQFVAQLQQQLLALQTTNTTLQQQVGDLQTTNTTLQQHVGDLKANNDLLPNNDAQIKYLEQQVDELQLQVNGDFVESNDLLGQVSSLTSTNTTLQAKVVDLTEQLQQANTTISHGLEQLRELERENSAVEDSLEQTKKELAAATQTEEVTPTVTQETSLGNIAPDDALSDQDLDACLNGFIVIDKADFE